MPINLFGKGRKKPTVTDSEESASNDYGDSPDRRGGSPSKRGENRARLESAETLDAVIHRAAVRCLHFDEMADRFLAERDKLAESGTASDAAIREADEAHSNANKQAEALRKQIAVLRRVRAEVRGLSRNDDGDYDGAHGQANGSGEYEDDDEEMERIIEMTSVAREKGKDLVAEQMEQSEEIARVQRTLNSFGDLGVDETDNIDEIDRYESERLQI